MKVRSGSSIAKYVGLGALSFALLAAPALVGPSAQALPLPGPDVTCMHPTTAAVPAGRRILDTSPVTAATHARIARDTAQTAAARSFNARTAETLPVYRVKVVMHVIHGSHQRERRVKKSTARRLFGILQTAYDGAQAPGVSAPMGIIFDLKKITISRNDRWFHAKPMSRVDKQMKRKLHRGTATTLNIYLNRPTFPHAGLLLGYSRFPQQYRGHKKIDGVTINVASMPNGGATGYNLGDTIVHETGHWLGLLHTFQDGCAVGGTGDGVWDTPAEATPNFTCPATRNSCPVIEQDATGAPTEDLPDPIHNFMDYSYDLCMNQFTAGQRARVDTMFATYRFGR